MALPSLQKTRLLLSLGWLLCLLVAAPGPARADAREHFLRGQTAYQQGNYELALKEWETAYQQEKKPGFLYNLALAYERLGQLEKSIEALKQFTAATDPDDPAISDANARLLAIKDRLAKTGIKIAGGADSALILVDGKEWGRAPRPDKIPVTPGPHEVILRHQDYEDFVSSVVVPAGECVEVKVKMNPKAGKGSSFFSRQPSAGPTSIGGAAPQNASQDKFFGSSAGQAEDKGGNPTFLYVLSGTLAAGAIGAGIWTADRHAQLDGCDKSDQYYCAKESAVRREQGLAFLLTIGCAAGAITALVFALTMGPSSDNAADQEKESAGQKEQAASCVATPLGAGCAMRF